MLAKHPLPLKYLTGSSHKTAEPLDILSIPGESSATDYTTHC